MNGHDALVAELRAHGGTWTDGPLGLRAADAIEELSKWPHLAANFKAERDAARAGHEHANWRTQSLLAERDAARAELAEMDEIVSHCAVVREEVEALQDRLDAVITLCDEAMAQPHHLWVDPAQVRAAATGDTR